MEAIFVITTCGSTEEAQRISDVLLEQRLIACANILPAVESRFHWKGNIETETEVVVYIKTTSRLFGPVKEAIEKQHSYETAEIIAIPIVDGSQDYLDWINKETR
jgi:periplasmic divalent cation tolerance protein